MPARSFTRTADICFCERREITCVGNVRVHHHLPTNIQLLLNLTFAMPASILMHNHTNGH